MVDLVGFHATGGGSLNGSPFLPQPMPVLQRGAAQTPARGPQMRGLRLRRANCQYANVFNSKSRLPSTT
jgi:hypothetical protein